ncbi:spermidine synthase [Streptomyces sp. V4-01]|uniref:Spermidine synthase n=1 Tax=Actinacidiphila polyblastidii TaxID=3110430 RepID=A0ABU7PGV8_9ACTN|nr:spermidine synthase [Streptomyces sp. V4-01]
MIDQRGRTQAPPPLGARLPVPAGAARALVLAAVFVCAACGLVYELELVALASYLVGDPVTQASVVLSVMVFAMGCGSLLAKRLRLRAAAAFAAVESVLALVGGLSVMTLYGFFAWYGQARLALVGCTFAIGVLIGAEVPLLMTLVQRIRRQDAGGAVADLFAADYVGGLVGGLAFPFLLLPRFGQLSGALATGVVNAVAGGAVVLWLFRADVPRRVRGQLLLANVAVLAVLGCAAAAAGPYEQAARRAVYGGQVRVAQQDAEQELVLTGEAAPASALSSLRLYADRRLRLCGADAAAYGRALADPALSGPPPAAPAPAGSALTAPAGGTAARVLLLGGGDGVALREALRRPGVRAVTVVDADAAMLRLGRRDPGLVRLNGAAFADPRVRTVTADPFDWLRTQAGHRAYDVILADLPEQGGANSAKFSSEEFYGLAARALAPGGRIAVHTGAAAVWTAAATLGAAGLPAVAYRPPGRTCTPPATWTFLLAGGPRGGSGGGLAPRVPAGSRLRPPPHLPPPSTLLHPRP